MALFFIIIFRPLLFSLTSVEIVGNTQYYFLRSFSKTTKNAKIMANVRRVFRKTTFNSKDSLGLQLVIQKSSLNPTWKNMAKIFSLGNAPWKPSHCYACNTKIFKIKSGFQINLCLISNISAALWRRCCSDIGDIKWWWLPQSFWKR